MIELNEAIEEAMNYAKKVYKDSMMENMRVEEVELGDDEENYLITLGWDDLFKDIRFSGATPTIKRVYKVFIVNAETGKVKMKVWK